MCVYHLYNHNFYESILNWLIALKIKNQYAYQIFNANEIYESIDSPKNNT